ncbi:MAG: retroviral-like aspartic protease family protein [candidate division WOR-3 bacterium]
MGDTFVKIKVSNLKNEKKKEVEILVDTGATYTALPEEILNEIGVEATGKINIEFANGAVEERLTGAVWIEVEGRRVPNPVIFAKKGMQLS